jgi:hypothetical protein
LFDANDKSLKAIRYEYEPAAGHPALAREKIFLPEKPVEVGLQRGTVDIRIGGTNYQFSKFPTVDRVGGRNCTVDYRAVKLGDGIARLPVRIEVRTAVDSNLVRSVEMTNFQCIAATPLEAKRAAASFAEFTPMEKRYRTFLGKYWRADPNQIPEPERSEIERLRNEFAAQSGGEDWTFGGELKRVNILMELSRMTGDEPALIKHYQRYLSLLAENGLGDFTLEGGHGTIETSVRWGRFNEAASLFESWVEAVNRSASATALMDFITREMKRGDFCDTLLLLDRLDERIFVSQESQFERAATRCVLMDKLRDLLSSKDPSQRAQNEKVIQWASKRMNPEDIASALPKALAESKARLTSLRQLSRFDEELKRQIETIDARSLTRTERLPAGDPF